MVISGYGIRSWQGCKRRYKIESQYRLLYRRPSELLGSVLRKSILNLSSGLQLQQVITMAVNGFMAFAKQPGLQVDRGINTYTLTMDFVAIIRTVLEYISRTPVIKLKVPADYDLGYGISWKFSAFEDESGMLHRFRFVDSVNEDALMKEYHSWEVLGDMVLGDVPMTIHMFAIGKREKGVEGKPSSHQGSPWCRAYKSPGLKGLYRFQKVSGKQLKESWKAHYYADDIDTNPVEWVDWMLRDDVVGKLVKSVEVRQMGDGHIDRLKRDLKFELEDIARYAGYAWDDMPMSKSMCDVPYTCPHQEVCYSENPVEVLKKSKIYKVIDNR